jgi:hypothetical protein
MSNFELTTRVLDLLESIAEYSRDPSDENWERIILQSIQIDSLIEQSYPQESENNDRTTKQ